MSFVLNGVLMVFLHLAPNAASAGYSIYQNHGIHIDHVVVQRQKIVHRKLHAKNTDKSS